eukprot:7116515-Lingulodinium_polyedra.AAC.1
MTTRGRRRVSSILLCVWRATYSRQPPISTRRFARASDVGEFLQVCEANAAVSESVRVRES